MLKMITFLLLDRGTPFDLPEGLEKLLHGLAGVDDVLNDKHVLTLDIDEFVLAHANYVDLPT